MTNSVEDYLSEDEMKEIAREAFTTHCAEAFRTDHERIFSNAAHKIVWEEVDKIVDGDLAALIAEKTKGAITKLDTYTVFRQKGVYERQDSAGYLVLAASVEKHKERIGNRVIALAETITKTDVMEALEAGDFTFKLSLT
jgi:hypothetical protein